VYYWWTPPTAAVDVPLGLPPLQVQLEAEVRVGKCTHYCRKKKRSRRTKKEVV
jgi:hypothetical protein